MHWENLGALARSAELGGVVTLAPAPGTVVPVVLSMLATEDRAPSPPQAAISRLKPPKDRVSRVVTTNRHRPRGFGADACRVMTQVLGQLG